MSRPPRAGVPSTCYDRGVPSLERLLAPLPHSALSSLPLLAWARRFAHGSLLVSGRLAGEVRAAAGRVPAGAVRVEIAFSGGERPDLLRAVAVCRGAEGVRRVALSPREAEAVVGRLWDPSVEARAVAAGEVRLRFAAGMEVSFPGGEVRVRGAACGPPDSLVLAGPLEVCAGRATVRFAGGPGVRWLSSLAAIRVERAVLHPDGRIALEGGACRGLDRAVRAALRRASDALSGVVRTNPRFALVRAFLA